MSPSTVGTVTNQLSLITQSTPTIGVNDAVIILTSLSNISQLISSMALNQTALTSSATMATANDFFTITENLLTGTFGQDLTHATGQSTIFLPNIVESFTNILASTIGPDDEDVNILRDNVIFTAHVADVNAFTGYTWPPADVQQNLTAQPGASVVFAEGVSPMLMYFQCYGS